MENKLTIAVAVAIAGIAFFLGRDCGAKSSDEELAAARRQLASQEETIKIKDGLFAEKVHEIEGLIDILGKQEKANGQLAEELKRTKQQLLFVSALEIKWRERIAVLEAQQSEGEGRIRVDFDGAVGPFQATGHTLTSPPEAHLSLRQIRPLALTIALSQARDGKWTTHVSTDDPDVEVNVALAGVNPRILDPTWKERIRLDFQVATSAIGYGVSYDFNRWGFGLECISVLGSGSKTGCGVSLSLRPFK